MKEIIPETVRTNLQSCTRSDDLLELTKTVSIVTPTGVEANRQLICWVFGSTEIETNRQSCYWLKVTFGTEKKRQSFYWVEELLDLQTN